MPRQLYAMNREHLLQCFQDRNYKVSDTGVYSYHDTKCFLKSLFTSAKLEHLYCYEYEELQAGGGRWNKYDIYHDNFCTICDLKGIDTGESSQRLVRKNVNEPFLQSAVTYRQFIEAYYSNGLVLKKQFGCGDLDDDIYGADDVDSQIEVIKKYLIDANADAAVEKKRNA